MEVKKLIIRILITAILFFIGSYILIKKTESKHMGERSLQILIIILVFTTLLTIIGFRLSLKNVPRLKKIDVQPGKKGERGRRGETGERANPLAECKDDMCFRKVMNHITNVVNLWNKVRGLPLLPQGTFIKNKYLQGKIKEMCDSPQLQDMLKKYGAHKLSFRDDVITDKCDINKDCGAYDYIFQKWTEWILILLKYRNGKEFLDSPLLTENEFNNMIHELDFEKHPIHKDSENKPVWMFPSKVTLGGYSMGMVLNPTNEEKGAMETKFKQSDFYKYYSMDGVPSAWNVSVESPASLSKMIDKVNAEEKRLKQIDSPFEEIKRYDAWYWGANESGLPKLINQCRMEEEPINQYPGKIRVKLTNNYTHLWNNSKEKQIKCVKNGKNHYFQELQLGAPVIDIYKPNDFVDEREDNLFFKTYKPVGYVCLKSNEKLNKESHHDILPLGKRYEAIQLNRLVSETGPRNLSLLVSGDVKPPLRYEKLINIERSEGFEKNNKKFTIWRPIAPEGYVALGDIVDVGAVSVYPDLNAIVCVPKSAVSSINTELEQIYNVETIIDSSKINQFVDCRDTDKINTDSNDTNKFVLNRFKSSISISPSQEKEIIDDIEFYEEKEMEKEETENRLLPFLNSSILFRCNTNSKNLASYIIKKEAFATITMKPEPVTIIKNEKNPIRYSILNIYNL